MPVLDYRQDRLDYGRMLIPPRGYRLQRAIATTYSLDLNTLLSVPVALFYSQTLEGNITGERFQVLEAIRRTSEIVTIYCQERQIHVPDRYNRLFAYMEDTVVQVHPSDAFTSFHPKVWVLRYVREQHEDQILYRVLVLTRNLTYDRSWDLAVNLEGASGAAARDVNRPLIDFLKHLDRIKPIDDVRQFTHDLARAKLAPPEGFTRIAFHPMGIDGYQISPLTRVQAGQTLCMSPFVDDKTVTDLRTATEGDLLVFGRKEELAHLSGDVVSGCRPYCISDLVVEGERMAGADEDLDESQEQDLHAKLFVFQQTDKCRWFIGSANATQAGQTRNTEFMVEMVGSDQRVRLDRAVEELLGVDNQRGVFEEFTGDMAGQADATAERRADLRRLEYQLVQVPLQGVLIRSENDTNYDLTVTIDLSRLKIPDGISIALKPLNCKEFETIECGRINVLAFTNIRESDISRFIAYRITENSDTLRSFLFRYELDGMPDSRLDSIFKSIVSNREKFYEYLHFLLTDDVTKGDLTSDGQKTTNFSNDDGGDFFGQAELPLFERLIVAASRDPAKLGMVDNVIKRLKVSAESEAQLVPIEFLDFWDVFRPFIQTAERGKTSNGER